MKWLTLFNKLGKQPATKLQKQTIYAVLYDKKSHKYERRYLCLKYDSQNRPYFIEELPKDKLI